PTPGKEPMSIHSSSRTPPPDEALDRIRAALTRAAHLGYRLVHDYPIPYRWRLLDAEDNEPLYSADTLDEIEAWLDT
ncbi:hypothetical protein, partial [Nocardia alni]|uniref:hypothetical protein n=1 Tax=Nocardia alni TaxID=2815723 RepID=UPI001C24C32A